jgi:threonine synthase
MDIQISSNFERALFEAYDRDGSAVSRVMEELSQKGRFLLSQGVSKKLGQYFSSNSASEEETLATIQKSFAQTGELLCPHSAIGVNVAEKVRVPETPMITLATAHPSKFPDAVEKASNLRPTLPERMDDLYERSERLTRVENDLTNLKEIVKERIKA